MGADRRREFRERERIREMQQNEKNINYIEGKTKITEGEMMITKKK